MNLLIPYVRLFGHPDPLFDEFTYGEGERGARKLMKDLDRGDYVFFHTSFGGKKYITAYYVVDRVLDTREAIKDKNIIAKFKNPHIVDILSGKTPKNIFQAVLFGDPITSRVLDRPLLFDKILANKLSLNIKFPEGKTETQAIGSATRAWRELTDKDIEVLFKEIEKVESRVTGIETVLSTEEVTEILEKDLEGFIEKNPDILGKAIKLKDRQLDTPVGRLDLLFEDAKGSLIVVELKLNKVGNKALNQLHRYMSWLKKETKKRVTGILLCQGVMPAFEEDFKKLKDIKIFCYGWKLTVSPWGS